MTSLRWSLSSLDYPSSTLARLPKLKLLIERISSITAPKALMKSCRSWKTGPQQQVEHQQDTDQINEEY